MTVSRLHSFVSSSSFGFALGATTLAVGAQFAHTFLQHDLAALVLFAASLVLWLPAIIPSRVTISTRIDETIPPLSRGRRVSPWFILGVVALAALTFLSSTDNQFTFDNVAAWVLSVAVFLYAFWEPEKSWSEWEAWLRERWGALRGGIRLSPRALALVVILLVAWFFYFYNLDGVPGEMDSDHAEKVLDVNDVVTNGLRPIFFERNTGREPLEFYLISGLVVVGQHPIDFMALKLVTATMGLLVIPAAFLFTRELFDDRVALIAAALIAISKWPVTIARMGLRFPFTPVFVAPLLFFLFRALKYRHRNDFLMTGLFLGAGLFGYNAFRIAPVLVAAFLALWLLLGKIERARLREYILNSVLVFAFALVVFMPLFRYSLDHPDEFWYRVLTRLSTEETAITTNPLQTLAQNGVNAALMFNWTGDEAWPNSIPGDPALDFISGGLFVLGLAFSVYRLVRYRERAYLFVLVGLAIMLLPTALSIAFPNENPSNVRAGGAIPFVFIIVALPLAWLVNQFRPEPMEANPAFPSGVASAGARSRVRMPVFVGILLVVIAGANFTRYFIDFNASYREFSWNSSEVASVLRGFADSVGDFDHVYIMLYPHWIDTRNVAANMGQIGWDQTLPNAEAAQAQAGDGSNKLYVLNPKDSKNLTRLQEILPSGQERIFHSRTPGHDFVLWYVPGTIAPVEPLESK